MEQLYYLERLLAGLEDGPGQGLQNCTAATTAALQDVGETLREIVFNWLRLKLCLLTPLKTN